MSGPGADRHDASAAALVDANKDLVRRYYAEVWGKLDPDACERFYDPTFTDHNPSGPRSDRRGAIRGVRLMMSSMSDAEMQVHQVIGEGPIIAAHWSLQWIQSGPFIGIPAADGQRLQLHGHDFYRVSDSRITDVWHAEDFHTVARSLQRSRSTS